MSETFLLELGTEDLPARYVLPLCGALAAGLKDGLAKRGVSHGAVREFATPRRIAVLIEAMAARQPDQAVERKGPQLAAAFKDGQPTPAALGFAKSCGVDIAKLKKENGQLVFRKKQKGKPTPELIAEIFEDTLKQMDQLVPKRMRWGAGEQTFVRPVQWIAALYGTRVLPLARFGLKAGRKTCGHRFHAPKAIALKAPADYEASLLAAKVQADFAARRAEIRRQVEAEAVKLGGAARISEELLDEVTALVEWPVAISGRIEERFLKLPKEVVVATVETNQRYFTVFDGAGSLLPYFITVANIESKDMAQVIAGNERVVRPRLTDALFFWEQDLKVWKRDANLGYPKLSDLLLNTPWGQQLKDAVYVKGLGTYDQRVSRVQLIASEICRELKGSDQDVQIAAMYAKLDLFSKVVYEFPELQGVMGGYYAKECGLPADVCLAILEQYLPNSASSSIPTSKDGCVLALADKLDSLAGLFALGQKPTASKDPFGLRRAALGLLRICVEGNLDIDLRRGLLTALQQQPAGKRDEAVLSELWDFVLGRFEGYCSDRLYQIQRSFDVQEMARARAVNAPLELDVSDWPIKEIVQSVRALGVTRPVDFMLRAEAVFRFLKLPQAAALAAAGKRARNILKQDAGAGAAIDPARFEQPAEAALAQALAAAETRLQGLRAQADYAAMLATLSTLKEPVDAFFEAVMVMAEDPAVRANRLALLAKLDGLCREVADLSCLPG